MLVLSPWDSPIPMTRAWCLWELLCTVNQPEVNLIIRLPRSQRRAFHAGLTDNFDVIMDSLRAVDARNAEAYLSHDKDMIFQAIEDSVGFDLMNEKVKEPLREWYLRTTVEITQAMVLMEDSSERQGRLMLNVGRALFDFGRYDDAGRFLRLAIATLQDMVGDVHESVADAVHHEARLLMTQGELKKAIAASDRSLHMRRQLHGETHLSCAECINTLGLVYSRMGDYDRAIAAYSDALVMQEKLVGRNHADVAITLNNLGNTHSRKKEGKKDCSV